MKLNVVFFFMENSHDPRGWIKGSTILTGAIISFNNCFPFGEPFNRSVMICFHFFFFKEGKETNYTGVIHS